MNYDDILLAGLDKRFYRHGEVQHFDPKTLKAVLSPRRVAQPVTLNDHKIHHHKQPKKKRSA
jgi:hypothetical protein